jgi:glycosyltransferase involved in cell wall biosynthesis
MRILLANQWYPPESGWGGVAMWNYAMANALVAQGHVVTVVTAQTNPQVPRLEERDGITIHRLFVRDMYRWQRIPLVGRYARELFQLEYARRVAQTLRALYRAQPFDVVEFADVNAEGFFYARKPDAAVVVRCHTPTFVLKKYYLPAEMPYDTRVISACEKNMIRRAHALTAPSHDMARVIADTVNIPLEKITVIPNALPAEFQISDFRFQISDGNSHSRNLQSFTFVQDKSLISSLLILHVGRLERVKGVRVLAEVIPRVVKQYLNVRFVFIGDDLRTVNGTSQRAELETFLEQAGARERVEFQAGIDHAALLEWYARADICVVPSLNYESFSYTCAQAMAAGKPVIASRIGGIPETIQDGVTGLLFEPGDVQGLVESILQLAEHPARRMEMGRAGRARALQEFDALRVAAQNLRVYERARQKRLAP